LADTQKIDLWGAAMRITRTALAGGKMPAKHARQKMRLSESQFSQLLSTIPQIKSKVSHTDRRNKIIILD
jgi:hypothetical protein